MCCVPVTLGKYGQYKWIHSVSDNAKLVYENIR